MKDPRLIGKLLMRQSLHRHFDLSRIHHITKEADLRLGSGDADHLAKPRRRMPADEHLAARHRFVFHHNRRRLGASSRAADALDFFAGGLDGDFLAAALFADFFGLGIGKKVEHRF